MFISLNVNLHVILLFVFSDLLGMESTSPPNPFARGPGFDPFADSFDPLHSNTVASNNNVDPQFQDLQVYYTVTF